MPSTEETVIALFDSLWFEHTIFTPKKSILSTPKTTSPLLDILVHVEEEEREKPKLNRNTTLMKKSLSDQFLSSKDISSDSSPKSVLMPQLQTILSGKEVENFPDLKKEEKRPLIKNRGKQRRKSSSSKSLSELEFEELKGFMDLGFVFSDEDKDSKLVSIIPGLQRFGKCNLGETEKIGSFENDEKLSLVSRPYLSEVWDCLEDEEMKKNNNNNQLMDFRIQDFGNEMVLKDQIKFWAHSVASAVK